MSNNQIIKGDFSFINEINTILNGALQSVDPQKCVEENLFVSNNQLVIAETFYDLEKMNQIFLIGFGKAVLPMARGITTKINSTKICGLLISKHPPRNEYDSFKNRINILQGSHPIPSQQSINSTKALIETLRDRDPRDLIICLISGGGSSLLTLPHRGISLTHIQELTKMLLESGTAINEINTIRKHMDSVKGGGLLKYFYPSKSISLILSDVINDEVSNIASGPTAPDPSTFQDALKIIEKYQLERRISQSIQNYIQMGVEKKAIETIKDSDQFLTRHKNKIIGSLKTAAEAARTEAIKSGFNTKMLSLQYEGEAREIGKKFGKKIKDLQPERNDKQPICLIAGGEPTVTITGSGKGGRNQELALAAAIEIQGINNCYFISFSTDGEDGPTDAAGAVVTGETIKIGREAGLNAYESLRNNDTYHFLEKTHSLIKIGPTGTNVNDLYLMLIY